MKDQASKDSGARTTPSNIEIYRNWLLAQVLTTWKIRGIRSAASVAKVSFNAALVHGATLSSSVSSTVFSLISSRSWAFGSDRLICEATAVTLWWVGLSILGVVTIKTPSTKSWRKACSHYRILSKWNLPRYCRLEMVKTRPSPLFDVQIGCLDARNVHWERCTLSSLRSIMRTCVIMEEICVIRLGLEGIQYLGLVFGVEYGSLREVSKSAPWEACLW